MAVYSFPAYPALRLQHQFFQNEAEVCLDSSHIYHATWSEERRVPKMSIQKHVLACLAILVALPLVLTNCGGGGGGGDGGGASSAVNGSVSGTTLIAVSDDSIVATYNTVGRVPDLDRDNDGVNESYSFTLTGIPSGSDIRIYVIKHGEIFPLYFDSDGDGIPDTNVFSFTSVTTINLGFVDTEILGQDGKAIPENDPTDISDVVGEIEDPDLPAVLNQPDTGGLSLSELIANGLDALEAGWVLRAKTYFERAEAVAGSSTSHDADTARFFYAMTRVAALGFDTYSDELDNGLNTLGDILDAFGSPPEDADRSNLAAISFPEDLPDTSPTGSELQEFLYGVVLPEIEGAISNLDAVSQSFNKQWTEPFDDETVESDYGDVLFFRAVLKGTLALVQVQNAYDLEADIAATANNDKTTEQFLIDEASFLSLAAAPGADLSAAETNISSGLDDLDAAIDWMDQETDNQDDDFISLGSADITQAKADIADVKASLSGARLVGDNNQDPNDDFTLDMSPFFAGLDFRAPNLLPPFTGNNPSGLFPDPTFAGIFGPEIDLNQDDDFSGVPDILEEFF